MARYYLDISARGNEYQAYADTPTTWGVPQEGNGKAASASSASVAIAVIDCTSAVAVAGNTLVICGAAAITCVTSGAAANQFNAGTGATLATNLAASINAATSTVAAAASALTLAIQYFLYARVNPGNSSQVQIMTRCAGSDMNNATNGTMVITNNTWTGGTAPTYTQFTGGTNGPWAYFANAGTVFGKTVGLYGWFVSKPATPTDPSGATDITYIRCARSGSALVLALSVSGVLTLAPPASRYGDFDNNGDIWAGDTGTFQIQITQSSTSAASVFSSFASPTPTYATQLMRHSDIRDGLSVTYTAPNINATLSVSGGGGTNVTDTNNALVLNGVSFTEGNNTSIIRRITPNRSIGITYGCTFNFKTNHSLEYLVSYATCYVDSNLTVNYPGIVANVPSIINIASSNVAANTILVRRIKKGKFNCAGWAVTTAMEAASPACVPNGAVFDYDVEGVVSASFSFPFNYSVPSFGLWSGGDADRSFRADTALSTVDWLGGGSYPGLRSVSPTGAKQSVKCTWPVGVSSAAPVYPVQMFTFNQQVDGLSIARTVTVDFLAESSIGATQSDIGMLVKYTDDVGVTHTESTLLSPALGRVGESPSLVASSESWTGIPVGFSAKKFVLTTHYTVAINTEISITIMIAGAPSSNSGFYFDLKPLVV